MLDALVPPARPEFGIAPSPSPDSTARQVMRKRLREGLLHDKEIEIEVAEAKPSLEILGPQGMEEMAEQLKGLFAQVGGTKRKLRKLKIGEARKLLVDEEAAKLVNEDEIKSRALANAENNGIVFIDEIDKIARRQETTGADVSREGVQRDLLPLVEGCTVNTKYGMVKTDHILFIASGAFHMSKPSDLIPEMQGRFPIRVELHSLGPAEFERILTEPENALIKQYKQLFQMEGAELEIREDALEAIALKAMARKTGARGLRPILEGVLLNSMYDLPSLETVSKVVVDETVIAGDAEPYILYESTPQVARGGD